MSCHLYLGIAQIAITPPPRTQTGTLGHFFFRHDFTILPFLRLFLPFFTIFSLNKCPKPSGQGFRPPQNQANAHLNLENSSLKKCPKPSGQGFRPPHPPPKRAMPTWGWRQVERGFPKVDVCSKLLQCSITCGSLSGYLRVHRGPPEDKLSWKTNISEFQKHIITTCV